MEQQPTLHEPWYSVDDENQSAKVVVPTLIFFIYALMAVIAKNTLRFNWTTVKSHDIALIAAAVLLLAQTACVVLSCNNGLGIHAYKLDEAQLHRFDKLTFAADLLSLFVLACAKVSVCLLISVITNQGYPWHHKRPVHGINQNHLFNANRLLFLVIIFCTIAGVVGLGVQNAMVHPAADQPLTLGTASWGGAMYLFNGVANIVTDLFLCLLPIAMMWKVQTCMTKKMQVVLLFGVRIIVPAVALPSLILRPQSLQGDDITWLAVDPVVWYQVSLNLSVLTACVPSLKSFIDSLTGYTSGVRIMVPYEYPVTSSGKSAGSKIRDTIAAAVYRGPHPIGHTTSITASQAPRSESQTGEQVKGSSESTRGLTGGGIHRNDRVLVTYETRQTSQNRSKEDDDI
ncbi:hypothetical protein PG996_005060 [Apiospora saccharicola]|uniref:Rhodopsin domain-containing protein n=1 Tax=Apiospora saccharicola TaxID=335842 RepID=A0ABR1VKQ2_9PEZI